MADVYTVSALAAALEVARAHGVSTKAPEILHERSNVLVRLGSVVARVPATTLLLRPDPTPWLALDVALSRYLTECDVPVVSPTTDPPAGPHFAQGLPVTLWHYTPHGPGGELPIADIAASLARVHEALREYPGELPEHGPLDDVHRMLDLHGHTMDGAAGELRAEAVRIAAELPDEPAQALHGDAHPGNVVATEAGPCWLDFEDAWRGPLGWDLGAFVKQAGPDVLVSYPGRVTVASLEPFTRLRNLFEVPWRYLIAQRYPHRLGEAREALSRYFG
ncbi:aminoglycoside phosphotransferase family protein [Amycolatopsis sp. H20-H5]|uniref:aminoglycoside phosphotransferase family protein n=1 Tax=Amycolatopsis sp. H20-H5 TaxID=3046309 RepID=UPI002DB6DD74|nr:aminoglycoside phosphotransferase family protein [Amycolatopsis sp. H20-H5]MEC3981372.1 aminoglycoside phosphotransferase family protein [Amycolatopsis sp. H20-H5]